MKSLKITQQEKEKAFRVFYTEHIFGFWGYELWSYNDINAKILEKRFVINLIPYMPLISTC